MPEMNGKETFAKLKEIEGFKTPVVALTANALSGMKEQYLKLGFNDYLAKPINKDELDELIYSNHTTKSCGNHKNNIIYYSF